METNMSDLEKRNDNNGIDLKRIINIAIAAKYWIILSLLTCLAGAVVFLRYKQPKYEATMSILLVNNEDQFTNNLNLISDALGVKSNTKIDNEIFIIKSKDLMSKTVESGGYNTRYFGVGRVAVREIYDNSPVRFVYIPGEGNENLNISIGLTILDTASYEITTFSVNSVPLEHPHGSGLFEFLATFSVNSVPLELSQKNLTFGSLIQTQYGNMSIIRAQGEKLIADNQYIIERTSNRRMTDMFCSNLNVKTASKSTDVLNLTLIETVPRRGIDVLKDLADAYNETSKAFKGKNILNTIEFLNSRISLLSSELVSAEGSFSNYRSANDLLDVTSQSQLALTSDMEYRDKLNDIQLQKSILDIIKGYISEMKENDHKLIPTDIGLKDVNLNSSILQYNQLVIDREKLLAGGDNNNPRVVNANKLLLNVKSNIMTSIENLQKAYDIQYQTTQKRLNVNQRQISSLPSQQQKLAELNRSQQIKEPLYLLLQQKREEAMIAYSSLVDQAIVVESADCSNAPFSPNRNVVWAIAILLGDRKSVV